MNTFCIQTQVSSSRYFIIYVQICQNVKYFCFQAFQIKDTQAVHAFPHPLPHPVLYCIFICWPVYLSEILSARRQKVFCSFLQPSPKTVPGHGTLSIQEGTSRNSWKDKISVQIYLEPHQIEIHTYVFFNRISCELLKTPLYLRVCFLQ